MVKKDTSTKKNGFITLGIGVLCLIGSLLMYKFLPIDDVFLVILMTFSLIIFIYGLFQMIRDSLQ